MAEALKLNWLQNQEFKEAFSQIINELLNAKLTEFILQREKEARDISLLKRILRVEGELKSLRELQERQFEFIMREMNTRFEALHREINARFEAMNTRFEALEKRLNFMQWFIGAGFALLSILIGLSKFF